MEGVTNLTPFSYFHRVLTFSSVNSRKSSTFALRFLKNWGCSSAGRALEWHSRGQGFDPPQLHQNTKTHQMVGFCILVELRGGVEPSVVGGLVLTEAGTGQRLVAEEIPGAGRRRVDPQGGPQYLTFYLGWVFYFGGAERRRVDPHYKIFTTVQKNISFLFLIR